MDSRFLESFVMVIDNGWIAEAARRLNITAAGVARASVLSRLILAHACWCGLVSA